MVNFLPTISLAQSILKCKFPSKISLSKHISPSKRAFEKYKPQGLFLEFYGMTSLQTVAFKLNPTACFALF